MSKNKMTLTTCDNCGCEFLCQDFRLRKHKHIFCCKKCEGEFRKRNNSNKVPCDVCGKMITVKPSILKKQKHFCCSYECMGKLREIIYLGENNPNYGNKGENNPIWKSDKKFNSYGYILVRLPEHPFCNSDGFVFEHRLVAEEYLLTEENSIEVDGKRYLKKEYCVHHKDRDKTNNSVENLEVMLLTEHTAMHAKERHNKRRAEVSNKSE